MKNKNVVTKKRRKLKIVKKVKNFFVNLWETIVKFFKNLYRKFMSLSLYVRRIIYVWVVIFLLIVIIIVLSASNNNRLNKYGDIENEMSNSALEYVEENELYPSVGSKLKLDLEFLIDYGYLYSDYVTDDSCKGYSNVYYDDSTDEYVVSSYLSCASYTTEGYSENK